MLRLRMDASGNPTATGSGAGPSAAAAAPFQGADGCSIGAAGTAPMFTNGPAARNKICVYTHITSSSPIAPAPVDQYLRVVSPVIYFCSVLLGEPAP
eukprot:1020500-Amphidinium_carterae.2